METLVALLRGVNLGALNRVAMPALREALAADGYARVRTYVQSGNIVLDTEREAGELGPAVAALLRSRFGLDVPVVVRTASELAAVVAANPFPEEAASRPKALQVTFRGDPVEPDTLAALKAAAGATERVEAVGREIYSWHPEGAARSKLALALTPKYAQATARNWTTVMTLLEMATSDAG